MQNVLKKPRTLNKLHRKTQSSLFNVQVTERIVNASRREGVISVTGSAAKKGLVVDEDIAEFEKVTAGYGRRLRAAREVNYLTQQDVADKLGISRTTYIAWETEARRQGKLAIPSILEFYRIAKFTNQSTTFLIYGDNPGEIPVTAFCSMIASVYRAVRPELSAEAHEQVQGSAALIEKANRETLILQMDNSMSPVYPEATQFLVSLTKEARPGRLVAWRGDGKTLVRRLRYFTEESGAYREMGELSPLNLEWPKIIMPKANLKDGLIGPVVEVRIYIE
jgi:transcriptional regulator with XRE-family HTH domain